MVKGILHIVKQWIKYPEKAKKTETMVVHLALADIQKSHFTTYIHTCSSTLPLSDQLNATQMQKEEIKKFKKTLGKHDQ